jgi:signal transduction histidine kinase
LKNDIKINLYRIIQEAINNIHKHSQAAAAEVAIEKSDHELVLIKDNGGRFRT